MSVTRSFPAIQVDSYRGCCLSRIVSWRIFCRVLPIRTSEMTILIESLLLLMLLNCVVAVYQFGYTIQSCDDLRPRRALLDVMNPQPNPQFINPSGNQLYPGISSPNGMSNQPVLMTTLSPYRIRTNNNRYRRGGLIEGKCNCIKFNWPSKYECEEWILIFCL